jgi:hypothetical protein
MTADWLVSPDVKTPPLPGGRVRSIPGLRVMKRIVVTRRSVLVSTIPIALASIAYTRKNTRPWKNTDMRSVLMFLKESLVPSVLRNIPGLRVRKRAAGTATFGDVTVGIIYSITTLLSSDAQDILAKGDKVSKRGTPHHLFMETVGIYDSLDGLPHMQEPLFKPKRLTIVFNGVVLRVTKSRKVIHVSMVQNVCVVKQCAHRVPHHAKNFVVLQFPIFE